MVNVANTRRVNVANTRRVNVALTNHHYAVLTKHMAVILHITRTAKGKRVILLKEGGEEVGRYVHLDIYVT